MIPLVSRVPAGSPRMSLRRIGAKVLLVCGLAAGFPGAGNAQTLMMQTAPVLAKANTITITLVDIKFGIGINSYLPEESTDPEYELQATQQEHWTDYHKNSCRSCKPSSGPGYWGPLTNKTPFQLGLPVAVDFHFSLPKVAAAGQAVAFVLDITDPTQVDGALLQIFNPAGFEIAPAGPASQPDSWRYVFAPSAASYTLRFSAASYGATSLAITGASAPLVVPEPSGFALASVGVLMLVAAGRRRTRA